MSGIHTSGGIWPVHPKPKEDELLSSWLARLAMAHGQKLHTFCSIAWPGKAIWNRDLDKSAGAEILQSLSKRTGTPYERVRTTTLASYEGVLYERYNKLGPAAWIMPVGVYHRTRRRFGLQYCPYCLADDPEPYYRRKWRLAFMTICEWHGVPLRDRCHQCGAAVNFHRGEMGDYKKFIVISLTLCYACGHDLRELVGSTYTNDASPSPVTSAEVAFTKGLLGALGSGIVRISESVTTYSVLYFAGLRHLMSILAMGDKRVERLRQAVGEAYGVETFSPSTPPRPDVQEMDVAARRRVLAYVRCLLEEWPERFIELSRHHKVWSSVWLRHMGPDPKGRKSAAPFWLWSVIHDHLYRARYCPSDEEMRAAVRHLAQKKQRINKTQLSQLIGVAVIRRQGVL